MSSHDDEAHDEVPPELATKALLFDATIYFIGVTRKWYIHMQAHHQLVYDIDQRLIKGDTPEEAFEKFIEDLHKRGGSMTRADR